ncbi:hypothetical protein C1632_04725 [Microbacterium testaceum]|uniref:hypothetical protein n=1 Tax=Microbacterium testaceum TaxID=2033 RepID=UPI000CCFAE75|nr:hypothetical protein [Microbacterium testaceum]PNW09714.1 hypothetical protein C1632_04725 [Microbacterium testaceum]
MSTTHIRDEALALGQIGPLALNMMVRVFGSVLRSFPALRSRESDADLVQSFFADRGQAYVVQILAASDDAAAERITRSWATNWLVSAARKLPFGALRNRLEKRLSRSSDFSASGVAHHWYLTDETDEDRPHTHEDLAEVAARSKIEVIGRPDGGVWLGRHGELEELLRQLLIVAGRMHVAEMTVICGNRFPAALQVGSDPEPVPDANWDAVTDTEEASDSVFNTAQMIRAERVALTLLSKLSVEDVTVIRFRDDIEQLAAELGCSRSSAYNARGRLRTHLQDLAGDGPEARDVIASLLRLVLDNSESVPSNSADRENTRAI